MTDQPDSTHDSAQAALDADATNAETLRPDQTPFESTSDAPQFPSPMSSNSDDSAVPTTEQPQPEETLPEETQIQSQSIATSRVGEPFPKHGDSLHGAFGRYNIERLLGEGAMGSVYLAHDSQLNRAVALKVPKASAMGSPVHVERFYREARAAATLTHPGICPVYDVGEINGRHYLTMGYIEGRPLDLYVEKNKNQPERRVVGVVRKLAIALQEAHENGIIHRDLKPANIMIDKRNDPIVMDFGLARQTDEKEARLTREGAVMGSPAYMSPEQVKGQSDIGPSTDIYSLGVVLYELLTGSTPFQGNVATVIGQILHTEPPQVVTRRDDVSPELAAICHRAFAKSLDHRYSTMQEFADDLGKFLGGQPTEAAAANPDAAETLSAEEVEKQQRRAAKLLKTEEYGAAAEVLTTLCGLTGEGTNDVKQWATAKLSSAEQKLSELEEEGRSLARRAKKCIDSGDFDRAVHLLDRIPPQLSSNKTLDDMRAEAQELSDEMAQLGLIIASENSVDRFELLETVERMLELKPDHRQANDLYDRLSKETTRPAAPKRKKKRGKKKQQSPALVWGGGLLVVVVAGVVIAQSLSKPPNNEDAQSDTQGASSTNDSSPDNNSNNDNNDRPIDDSVGADDSPNETDPDNDFGPKYPRDKGDRPRDDRPRDDRPRGERGPPRPGEKGFRPRPPRSDDFE